MKTAKLYELRVGGHTLSDLSEGEVTELFRRGRITSTTACRAGDGAEWEELNEHLPLLKYEILPKEGETPERRFPRPLGETRFPWMSQWKVGLSCFAAGVLIAGAATTLPGKLFSREKDPRRGTVVVRAEPFEPIPEVRGESRHTPRPPEVDPNADPAQPGNGSTLPPASAPPQGSQLPGNAAIPPALDPPPPGPEEAIISLQKWTTVRSAFGSFRIRVRDEGPGTILVWLGYSDEPRRFEKVKGFEAYGTNIVQIHSLPGAKVYYVSRLTAPIGRCVLKVIPDT